jgi:hypothetical protein
MLSSTYSLRFWPLLYARSSSSLAYGSSSSIVNVICRDQNRRLKGYSLIAQRGGAEKKLHNLFPARPAGGFCCGETGLTDALRSPLIHDFSRLGYPSASYCSEFSSRWSICSPIGSLRPLIHSVISCGLTPSILARSCCRIPWSAHHGCIRLMISLVRLPTPQIVSEYTISVK